MKKLTAVTVLTLLLVFMTGCDLKTTVDYDREADFATIKTYSWDEPDELTITDLNHRRIIAAVDSQLELKGIQKVDSDPDVFVTYFTDDDEQVYVDTTTSGYGYGPGMYWDPYWGGGMGMTTSTSQVRSYTVGTLVVDIYDAEKKQLVWRGVVTATLDDNPKNTEKKINKGVAKLFEKYPPPAKN